MPPRPDRRPGRPAKRAPKRAAKKFAAKKFAAKKKAAPTKPEGRAGAWGGVARRGAGSGGSAAPVVRGRLAGAPPSRAADAFRAAGFEPVDDEPVRRAASGAVRRGTKPPPAELTASLGRVVGPSTAPKLAARLAEAARAFQAERFADARRILAPLADRAPASDAVRELYGLTLYKLGKWREAVRELEAFRGITGSTDQHPVLADCYRALGRYDEVEALWRELREVSPSAELVAEGRIVHAGALADRGRIQEAIADIEPAVRKTRRPRGHHLRLLYVLADLYERAGDLPRARSLFERVVAAEPDFADADARLRAL
jgi:tetratricopeptide (TPR) repeat protein